MSIFKHVAVLFLKHFLGAGTDQIEPYFFFLVAVYFEYSVTDCTNPEATLLCLIDYEPTVFRHSHAELLSSEVVLINRMFLSYVNYLFVSLHEAPRIANG